MAKSSLLSRVLGGLLLVLLFAAARGADAKGLKVLYSFSGGSDGGWPTSGLIMDAGGNLYGTTYGGGVVNNSICRGGNTNYTCGVVFKLSQGGAESVLYTFCTQGNCADGADPASGLVADQAGDFYGTTMIGGANDSGTVFELAAGGTETVLHSFCSEQNCADGGYPVGGLAADRAGDLYGAAGTGGNDSAGVIFEIAPNGTYTVLYSFTGGSDGGSPWAPLLIDKAGNLYGTSAGGGAINANCPNGCGTVFELNRKGAESVLYRFCSQNDCRDGSGPNPGVTADKSGNLYGTTFSGGAHGYGSVFEVTPDGKESVIYSFYCSKKQGCKDGHFPYIGVTADSEGNLYGGTSEGLGDTLWGDIFKLDTTGKFSEVQGFNPKETPCCSAPSAPVLLHGRDLYAPTAPGATGAGSIIMVTE